MVDTYNAEYPNSEGIAHGGYAGAIRVREDWVFKVRRSLPIHRSLVSCPMR